MERMRDARHSEARDSEARDGEARDGEARDSEGDPGADSLQMAQDKANALLRAGQDAINRALSRDSTQFLNAMRQEGGQ